MRTPAQVGSGCLSSLPPRMVLPRWFLPLLLSSGTWGYTTSHGKQVGVAIGQPLAPETIPLFLLPINPRVWNPLYKKWSQGGVATPQVPSLPSQPSWRGKWTPARAGAGSVSPPPSQSPVLRGSGILGEDLGHGRGLGIIRPPEPTGTPTPGCHILSLKTGGLALQNPKEQATPAPNASQFLSAGREAGPGLRVPPSGNSDTCVD